MSSFTCKEPCMSFTTDRALLQEPLAPLMCFLLEDPPTVCSCTPAQTDGCMPGALPTALRRMSLGLDQNGPISPLVTPSTRCSPCPQLRGSTLQNSSQKHMLSTHFQLCTCWKETLSSIAQIAACKPFILILRCHSPRQLCLRLEGYHTDGKVGNEIQKNRHLLIFFFLLIRIIGFLFQVHTGGCFFFFITLFLGCGMNFLTY